MTNVKGIAASSGYAIAKAYKLDMPDLTVTRTTVEDTEAEIALYNKSVAAVKLRNRLQLRKQLLKTYLKKKQQYLMLMLRFLKIQNFSHRLKLRSMMKRYVLQQH